MWSWLEVVVMCWHFDILCRFLIKISLNDFEDDEEKEEARCDTEGEAESDLIGDEPDT